MTFVLSLLPIAVLVAALVVVKAPAWKAALAALVVGAAEALFWRGMSAGEFAGCAAQGVSTGLFPIGLVIFAALFTYAITETSGAIADIKGGLCSLSSDSRFLALLVAWGFGNFMEGMAGFGTAVAIPCAILVGVGFDPARAVLCCLVANSTPTAFGSVGVPTSVLASETGLDVGVLTSSIVLLQLAVTALLPFFVLVAADGWRALRECWKLALGASIAFVVPWCLAARFTGCELPDIVGGITVMALFAFLGKRGETNVRRQLWAWMPFAFVVVALGAVSVVPPEWKPSPGIVVLSAGALGGLCQGVGPLRLLGVAAKTAADSCRGACRRDGRGICRGLWNRRRTWRFRHWFRHEHECPFRRVAGIRRIVRRRAASLCRGERHGRGNREDGLPAVDCARMRGSRSRRTRKRSNEACVPVFRRRLVARLRRHFRVQVV